MITLLMTQTCRNVSMFSDLNSLVNLKLSYWYRNNGQLILLKIDKVQVVNNCNYSYATSIMTGLSTLYKGTLGSLQRIFFRSWQIPLSLSSHCLCLCLHSPAGHLGCPPLHPPQPLPHLLHSSAPSQPPLHPPQSPLQPH